MKRVSAAYSVLPAVLLATVVVAGYAANPVAPPPRMAPLPTTQSNVVVESELFITGVKIVDDARTDPGGPWHFGTLMERMSGGVAPGVFIDEWLGTWRDRPVINGEKIKSPGKIQAVETIRAHWKGLTTPFSQAHPADAPFHLLAIVNRPDLVRVENGQIVSAGEARFIFATDTDPNLSFSNAKFHVIFEYDIPASTCEEVKAWHERWHALTELRHGSPEYLAALQSITDDVTLPEGLSSLTDTQRVRANGSFLGQLRSNEIDLPGSNFWDLREWELTEPSGQPGQGLLLQSTTKQTPHMKFLRNPTPVRLKDRDTLGAFLDQNQSAILDGTHVVGDTFDPDGPQGSQSPINFLGGQAINDMAGFPLPPGFPTGGGAIFGVGTVWWATGYEGWFTPGTLLTNDELRRIEVRHKFALNTCSGCHFHETGTTMHGPGMGTQFLQVANRKEGEESQLSHFLTGLGGLVPDPMVDPNNTQVEHRRFFDLANRAIALDAILNMDCNLQPLQVLQGIIADRGARAH